MGTLITRITPGQERQIIRFGSDAVETALEALELDKDGAQRVIECGGELASAIKNAARAALQNLSVSDLFKNEEVSSNYGYLSGYTKPVEITDQIDVLRSHWPSLNPDAALRYFREVYPTLWHPRWVEGPFALIRPGFFSDKYGEELEEVLSAIKKDRKDKFQNRCEGCLGEKYLHQTDRTRDKTRQFVDRQPGSDILIVGEQFGIRHRGRSVRRTREVFISGEYGEGAKNIGTMILTNPVRLKRYDDLWIDCPDDEYSPDADGDFSHAPLFSFKDGEVKFGIHWYDYAGEGCGSASAFLLR